MKEEIERLDKEIFKLRVYIGTLERELKRQGYMDDKIKQMRDNHSLTSSIQTKEVLKLDKIMDICCAYYNQDKDSVLGTRRLTELINPRHMFCYLAKNNTRLNDKEIGKYINRDRTTVINAVKNITNWLTSDKGTQRDYNQIIKLIK
jgi:chromosomal replication initiation ATPase DnaA